MFGSEKKKKRRSNVHGNDSSGSGKKRSIECTHECYTLPTYKGGRYCQQCYNNQLSRFSSAQKKKKCYRSIKGCPACNEPICKECWNAGYDNVRHRPRIT